VEYAKKLKPLKRGELEITDINNLYLESGSLQAQILGRGFVWIDAGTIDSLCEATNFIQMIEKRQGIKISAPEELAYHNKWITKEELIQAAIKYGKSSYGKHLMAVAEGKLIY